MMAIHRRLANSNQCTCQLIFGVRFRVSCAMLYPFSNSLIIRDHDNGTRVALSAAWKVCTIGCVYSLRASKAERVSTMATWVAMPHMPCTSRAPLGTGPAW
eukprot:1643170-Amphidinium_carterae.2